MLSYFIVKFVEIGGAILSTQLIYEIMHKVVCEKSNFSMTDEGGEVKKVSYLLDVIFGLPLKCSFPSFNFDQLFI